MNQVSSKAIKALIKKIIEAESSVKPTSDGAISDLLAKEGYQVARRTVAKYREALRIPPVSLRKIWPDK
jgi:RNA polymerase sigma-54 factor